MLTHFGLVFLFMCPICSNFILNLFTYRLITLKLFRSRILQVIDLEGDFCHALLEVFSKLRPKTALFIQHLLVIQVQVMILFED